jgi:6-phosphogluconolactonase (cycloisomerase 2 family)
VCVADYGSDDQSEGGLMNGGVYLQTNDAERNEVAAFRRGQDGRLERLGRFATGGHGTGVPHLTSQGSIVLTRDGAHLLVTNAGSDDVSLFAVRDDGLALLAREGSGGSAPTSVAEHDGVVYVLNAGAANVTGFRIQNDRLMPIEGSTRDLSAPSADPAQVGFSPDGTTLVVTERGTDRIVAYLVSHDGVLGNAALQASSGPTPYGFAFSDERTLVVTEAFGAQVGKAAASSYRLENGVVTARTRPLGNGRSEICWAVVSHDGRYAFTTNFADGAVSRYAIAPDGTIELEDAAAGTTVEGRPGLRDEDLTPDGRYLYAVDADAQRVFGWAVGVDGALEPLGSWDGLPATVAGLAAR